MRKLPNVRSGYFKAHGHGNDYLVFEEGPGQALTPELIGRICDRHRGLGSDGLVIVEASSEGDEPRLRMFNPDGGEFERSGNGVRIAGLYLRRTGLVRRDTFSVILNGERVELEVAGPDGLGVYDVTAAMGQVTFPTGPPFVAEGRVNEKGLVVLPGLIERGAPAVAVAVGNPHLVVFGQRWTKENVSELAPAIARDAAFPQGINVQLAIIPEERARELSMHIWERGVGPTSASGTSACAVVAAAVHLKMIPHGDYTVKMAGGKMKVEMAEDWSVRLRGPIEEVCVGELASGFLAG